MQKKVREKKARTWDDGPIDAKLKKELDRSAFISALATPKHKPESKGKKPQTETKQEPSTVMNFLSKLIGTKPLTNADLEPSLEHFRMHLISKNVTLDSASSICKSVNASLLGQTTGTLTTVKSLFKTALESALLEVLECGTEIDVISAIKNCREQQNRAYSIVFVGVNGVGKTTSLAKVGHLLTRSKMKVSIVACDTFRSGAVEQLRVHAKNLQAPLFERGYGKDATLVAMEGIAHATKNGSDVVLVDTAGRMQDNTSLMKSLARLIDLNKPDLVLFVGEALAGNDSVDQVTKFIQTIHDSCGRGIILTKFDTVDTKVGSAISLTHATKVPVMFVGVGQTYDDLQEVNAHTISSLLLT